MRAHLVLLGPAIAGLAACVQAGEGVTARSDFDPAYGGISTVLLDGDLVNFHVAMQGARDRADVDAYARCAAAQYALIRGAGFARHVRTQVAETGGNWRGDAVYTISAALPAGLATIDAEVTVRDCAAQGIPTI
ncbi:hypothetical protein JL811_08985 [Tabrizicola sp. DMG-N-6]|uniref:Lipoprotein n=1 Tax=Szabonella alba TaxID=2804194 RepID=A0A8K0XZP5_9RHOB|nr:hypothetical protein [Szabonella alba]MBL4917355.1 hypothetical protein [Szabonella alba]